MQPARTEWLAANGPRSFYHYNAVQAWAVANGGESRLGAMHGEVAAMIADLERRHHHRIRQTRGLTR